MVRGRHITVGTKISTGAQPAIKIFRDDGLFVSNAGYTIGVTFIIPLSDPNKFAFADNNFQITVWSGRNSVHTYRGHSGSIFKMFKLGTSENDERILSASDDGTIKIWKDGFCIKTLVIFEGNPGTNDIIQLNPKQFLTNNPPRIVDDEGNVIRSFGKKTANTVHKLGDLISITERYNVTEVLTHEGNVRASKKLMTDTGNIFSFQEKFLVLPHKGFAFFTPDLNEVWKIEPNEGQKFYELPNDRFLLYNFRYGLNYLELWIRK